jgi:FAD/FMN-containing dehydrogenase
LDPKNDRSSDPVSLPMSRRRFLDVAGAGAVALALGGRGAAKAQETSPAAPASTPVLPGGPKWPEPAAWERLNESLHGRLIRPVSPVLPCQADPRGEACRVALKNLENPFWLEAQAGATQTTGWAKAWATAPSPYAIAAETAQDIAEGVKFARKHGLRLVVKATGHDYLGRSNDGKALLIWTHRMRGAVYNASFVPEGAPAGSPAVKALTVQAGTRWIEAYTEATTRNGRYVQGGGCTTVGAAGGFTLGGGFGSFSKKFGTGAAGVVELEVVLADGSIVVANAYRNEDLFWALRGGGGGTFGIVTRITYRTHGLPETFGVLRGKIQAKLDADYRALIERFLEFYEASLCNEHWGEQFAIRPDNSIEIVMLFQGLTEAEVAKTWAPLKQWLDQNAARFSYEWAPIVLPAREMWNYDYWKANNPELVVLNTDPMHTGIEYWWAPNSGEVSGYYYTYQSTWIPRKLLGEAARKDFAQKLFDASRHYVLGMHTNKGLAGASADAVERGRKTSTHPAVYDAAALLILVARKQGVYPGLAGREPDMAEAAAKAGAVTAAMDIVRTAAPDAGTYANEADYFEENWQRQFYGPNYPRLLEIKKKVDPDNLFRVHHGVGSDLPG